MSLQRNPATRPQQVKTTVPHDRLPGPIGFLLIPQFTAIAYSSAVESLRIANRYALERYRWILLSIDGEPVPDSNGVMTAVHGSLDQAGTLGTLLICSDLEPDRYATPQLKATLQRLDAKRVTLGGIDTGAYLLARAGLLDFHCATLHWENAPAFSERYPNVRLKRSLFEFDNRRVTCAGGTAAIDMMLYAIEARHGRALAVRVSEHFLHARIRDGCESQRLSVTDRFGVHHPKVVQAIKVMEDAIDAPLSAAQIASKIGLSGRQLSRLFRDSLGQSIARFYLARRLETARGLVVQSDRSMIDIALACGFQSQSHFSRAYRVAFGCTPQEERRRAALSYHESRAVTAS